MKKCSYCGKEYPDEAAVCSIDGQPLETIGALVTPGPQSVSGAAKPSPVKPALMTKLRSLHLYLGCIFAPMLLFFVISGIWQTLGFTKPGLLATLSTIHTAHKLKVGKDLNSPLLTTFILIMALAFIITTTLGIIMALNFGRSRRAAIYCLAFGVAFPLLLVLIRLL